MHAEHMHHHACMQSIGKNYVHASTMLKGEHQNKYAMPIITHTNTYILLFIIFIWISPILIVACISLIYINSSHNRFWM